MCARGACTGARSSSSRCTVRSARCVQLEREDARRDPRRRPRRAACSPDRTRWPSSSTQSVDTANASQLARVAVPGARVTVVEGRFQHVNFIFAPAPLRIRVVEVVPPFPPKLLDMARTVLEYDEELPPLELDLVAIDLRELAAQHPSDHYLFPCRCAGLELGAPVDFLDAGPPGRRRLDAARLRALAPDPRGALRPRSARAGRLLPAAGRGRAGAGAHAAEVLPARARDRAHRRADDRAVGREPGRGARGARRSSRRDRHRPRRLGHLRAPVGDRGDPRAARRRRPHAGLGADRGHAGRGPGRARHRSRPRPPRSSPGSTAPASTCTPSARRRGRAGTRRSG